MRLNPNFFREIEKHKSETIIVEGKKDASALKSLGFNKVFIIHQSGISFKERIEQLTKEIGRKEEVCILTDFDKKGKQLYFSIKSYCSENGIKLDSTLRGLLLKSGLSHIEGLYEMVKKTN